MTGNNIDEKNNLFQNDPNDLFDTAYSHELLGECQEAQHLYQTLLRQDDRHTLARLHIAALMRHSKQFTEHILVILDAGLAYDQTNCHLHGSRALTLIDANRKKEAQQHLIEACCHTYHDFDALYELGILCNEDAEKRAVPEMTLLHACQKIDGLWRRDSLRKGKN